MTRETEVFTVIDFSVRREQLVTTGLSDRQANVLSAEFLARAKNLYSRGFQEVLVADENRRIIAAISGRWHGDMFYVSDFGGTAADGSHVHTQSDVARVPPSASSTPEGAPAHAVERPAIEFNPPPKMLTAGALVDIVRRTNDTYAATDVIVHAQFVRGMADLVTRFCGGRVGAITRVSRTPTAESTIAVDIHRNDFVTDDGGVYKYYDPETSWQHP